MEKKRYNVGKIVNTHGLLGEVKVHAITDFPEERFKKGNTLYLQLDNKPLLQLTIHTHRIHKNHNLLTFVGYHSIELVEPFKGAMLQITEDERSPLPEGEYYFDEIIGCQVFKTNGESVGMIKEILQTNANDIWVIRGKLAKDLLIPYIDQVVKEINIKEKKIIIQPIPGLLD